VTIAPTSICARCRAEIEREPESPPTPPPRTDPPSPSIEPKPSAVPPPASNVVEIPKRTKSIHDGAPLATYAEPWRPFTGQTIGQSSRDP